MAFSNATRRAHIVSAQRVAPPTIAVSIDLDAPGKRIGHLELGWSDDEHAYGVIPVPIAVIAKGSGPSVLVTAGVHGDEYEGLVITRRLIAEISPAAITGRIVVMTADRDSSFRPSATEPARIEVCASRPSALVTSTAPAAQASSGRGQLSWGAEPAPALGRA